MRVRVEDAPGYEDFGGDRIAELETPDRRLLSVIEWESDESFDCGGSPRSTYYRVETFIIPSQYVREL